MSREREPEQSVGDPRASVPGEGPNASSGPAVRETQATGPTDTPTPGSEPDPDDRVASQSQWLSAYLDGELESDDLERAEAELDESPELRADMQALRELLATVGSLPTVAAPPDFCEKLTRKIRRRQLLETHVWQGLGSLPFQVISIIVVIAIATAYMMVQLDLERRVLERDPTVTREAGEPSSETDSRPALPIEAPSEAPTEN